MYKIEKYSNDECNLIRIKNKLSSVIIVIKIMTAKLINIKKQSVKK